MSTISIKRIILPDVREKNNIFKYECRLMSNNRLTVADANLIKNI